MIFQPLNFEFLKRFLLFSFEKICIKKMLIFRLPHPRNPLANFLPHETNLKYNLQKIIIFFSTFFKFIIQKNPY